MPTRRSTDAEVLALDGLHLYHAKLSNSSMRVRLLLEEKGLEFSEAELQENREVITNWLRQELVLRTFGDEESYRIHLDLDRQVQTALEQLPEAEVLLAQGTRRHGN